MASKKSPSGNRNGSTPLPFDVADQRTIMVNHQDLDSVAAARDELRRQVEALGDGSLEIDTPRGALPPEAPRSRIACL